MSLTYEVDIGFFYLVSSCVSDPACVIVVRLLANQRLCEGHMSTEGYHGKTYGCDSECEPEAQAAGSSSGVCGPAGGEPAATSETPVDQVCECQPDAFRADCNGVCKNIPQIVELQGWSVQALNGKYLHHGVDNGRPLYINAMHSARIGWHTATKSWAIMSIDGAELHYVCDFTTPVRHTIWRGHPCVPPDMGWRHVADTVEYPGLIRYTAELV